MFATAVRFTAVRWPPWRRCNAKGRAEGSVPHDLDSDGTQVAGIKGLLQRTHLIQDTPNSPYICLAIVCLALHSCQTYLQCLHDMLALYFMYHLRACHIALTDDAAQPHSSIWCLYMQSLWL